jgi:hypothetical protein
VVRVSIDIRDGGAHFVVVVRAESVERAVEIVGSRYPGADVRAKLPMDPEGLFANDPAVPQEGIVGLEQPGRKLYEAGAKEGSESMHHQPAANMAYRLGWTTQGRSGDPSLWDRILGLIEQDLAERRDRELFVEVAARMDGRPAESGSYRKEIGELSASERRSLHPDLREKVAEQLLDRYLAEQGYVDLADRRRAYTKKIEALTPQDLPALIEADQQRTEKERQKERERAEFIQEVRADLERLLVIELVEGKEVKR